MIDRHLIVLLAAVLLGRGETLFAAEARKAASPFSKTAQGEFGAPLDFLWRHYSAPEKPGESNYFIDLWADQNLKTFASECRITNNHALFINSHGGGVAIPGGSRYSYSPHQNLLKAHEKTPCYSAGDLAALLGPANAKRIHNILVSGCNADSSFNAGDLRKYFLNATNIVHMPGGKSGYQPMFLQILASQSSNIGPVYEVPAPGRKGKREFFMGTNPSANSTVLSPYVAELFKPGDPIPFRSQTAGRELLCPDHPSLLAH